MAQSTGGMAQEAQPPAPGSRRWRRRAKMLTWRAAMGAAYGIGCALVAYAGKEFLHLT
ncbi:hypothetical protein [Streptomyces nitrosporeus]|uniref:hypothetical protein n=1 Tax=Streptomyces nitrosporeus TaxID=28894 RepID=UPI00167E40FD|nr:hypothetical protein [Streptomyces nitrosporeus]GGZ29976.1 hypothetical protein GCM10010327_70280 [Streptomyces nitrosporeus]